MNAKVNSKKQIFAIKFINRLTILDRNAQCVKKNDSFRYPKDFS